MPETIDAKMFPRTTWRTWNIPVDADTDTFWLDRVSRWAFPATYGLFGDTHQKLKASNVILVLVYWSFCLSYDNIGHYENVSVYKN